MSLIYLIFERHHNKPFMIHRLTNPDKHWYWQVCSLNGLRTRSLNRRVKGIKGDDGKYRYQPQPCPLSFDVEFEHIHQERLDQFSFISKCWEDIPIQEHETVFDFYRVVGIDYKKDQWPTLEQRQENMK